MVRRKIFLAKIRDLTLILLVTFLALELIFRLLPVSDSLELQPVNRNSPVAHYKPNRLVTRSTGYSFDHIVEKKVNNYGYLSDLNFEASNNKRKIVVIGDSYVEALQVSNAASVHGYLNKLLPLNYESYGIGVSGSPLSQYLIFAKKAIVEFKPEYAIILVVANDFDESLLQYKAAPGMHYFDASFNLVRIDYRPTVLKQILRTSAFARYLHLDYKISSRLERFSFQNLMSVSASQINITNKRTHNSDAQKREVTNLLARKNLDASSDQKDKRIKKMLQHFFGELSSLDYRRRIIFLLDADRGSIYNGESKRRDQSFFKYFISFCEKNGYRYLDLQESFSQHFSKNGQKFEFLNDAHWNELAHRLSAELIIDRINLRVDKN